MIELLLVSAIHAASFQSAAANNARNAFRTCINQVAEEAKNQKLPADSLPGLMQQRCTSQAAGFKSALWAIDSKNKVSKKQSEEDADLQLEELVLTGKDRYEMETTPQ